MYKCLLTKYAHGHNVSIVGIVGKLTSDFHGIAHYVTLDKDEFCKFTKWPRGLFHDVIHV